MKDFFEQMKEELKQIEKLSAQEQENYIKQLSHEKRRQLLLFAETSQSPVYLKLKQEEEMVMQQRARDFAKAIQDNEYDDFLSSLSYLDRLYLMENMGLYEKGRVKSNLTEQEKRIVQMFADSMKMDLDMEQVTTPTYSISGERRYVTSKMNS